MSINNLTLENRKYLLKLARNALVSYLEKGQKLNIGEDSLDDILKQKKATFVTLTKNGELRGCIGKLIPIQALYLDVIENTYSAAFKDPRFPELEFGELTSIQIEISVLDDARALEYIDSEDLIAKLGIEKPGVILSSGYNQATFLPQVWEDISNPAEFLTHLCAKAGLSRDHWMSGKLDIQTYEVLKFGEGK